MTVDPQYYRSQAKRDRTPTHQWVKRMIGKAYTQEQWMQMFRAQEEKYKLDKLIDTHVDKKMINENTGLQVNIMLQGIEAKRVIQVHAIPPDALEEHDTE